MKTLEGYGAVPHICGILLEFWERQKFISQKMGTMALTYRQQGRKPREASYRLSFSIWFFDNMVRNWLSMTVYDTLVAHDRLVRSLGCYMGMFYANDGLVGSWEPEGLQGAINVLICFFWWCGLVANISKSKSMTCQPGVIRSRCQRRRWSGRARVGGNVKGEA